MALQKVQLAVGDAPYRDALSSLLAFSGAYRVAIVDRPDPRQPGVLVVGGDRLEALPIPLTQPERVVVIARNDAGLLARAWDAGIRCVVSDTDSPRTMELAVMAAALRVKCPNEPESQAQITQPAGRQISEAKDKKPG